MSVAGWAGIVLDQSVIKTFINCSSSGSAAQTIVAGDYVASVSDEDVYVCVADSSSTCASGGTRLKAGAMLVLQFQGSRSVSCRSTGSTGDLEMTKKGN